MCGVQESFYTSSYVGCLHFGLVNYNLLAMFSLHTSVKISFSDIICWIILETEKGIFQAILEGKLDLESAPWPSISASAKDLIRKMLSYDPKKRITASDALGKSL